MKSTVYLVFTRHGVDRLTKGKPALSGEEYAIKLTVAVPDAAFQRFEPTANIEIPTDFVMTPKVDVVVDRPPAYATAQDPTLAEKL